MIRVRSLSELTYPKPSLRVAASIPLVNGEEHPVAREYVNCEETEKGGERGSGWFEGSRTADYGGDERGKNSVARRLEELVKNVIWTEDRWPEEGQLGWRRKSDAIALLEEFIAKLVVETYLGVKPGTKKRKIVLGLDELIKRLTAGPEVVGGKKPNNPFRGDYKAKLSPAARELVSSVAAACLYKYRKQNAPHQLGATQQPLTCEIGQRASPFSPESPETQKFCIPAETLLPYRRDKKSGYRLVKNEEEIEIPKETIKRRSKRKAIPEIQTPPREKDVEKKLRDYRASRRNARRNELQGIQLDETSANSLDDVKAEQETITVSSDEESLEKRLKQSQQPNKKVKINNNSKEQPIETIPLKAKETNRLKIDQPISPPEVIDNH